MIQVKSKRLEGTDIDQFAYDLRPWHPDVEYGKMYLSSESGPKRHRPVTINPSPSTEQGPLDEDDVLFDEDIDTMLDEIEPEAEQQIEDKVVTPVIELMDFEVV